MLPPIKRKLKSSNHNNHQNNDAKKFKHKNDSMNIHSTSAFEVHESNETTIRKKTIQATSIPSLSLANDPALRINVGHESYTPQQQPQSSSRVDTEDAVLYMQHRMQYKPEKTNPSIARDTDTSGDENEDEDQPTYFRIVHQTSSFDLDGSECKVYEIETDDPKTKTKTNSEQTINSARKKVRQKITIHFSLIKPRFLGGYKNNLTEKTYYHSEVQFPIHKLPASQKVPKYERNTQTVTTQNKLFQTPQDNGTQMQRKDLHMDLSKDKHYSLQVKPFANPYFDSEQLYSVKKQSAHTIQCAWRQHLARKEYTKRKEESTEKKQKELEETKQVFATQTLKQQTILLRENNPQDTKDFNKIRQMLTSKSVATLKKIDSSKTLTSQRKTKLKKSHVKKHIKDYIYLQKTELQIKQKLREQTHINLLHSVCFFHMFCLKTDMTLVVLQFVLLLICDFLTNR